MTFMEVLSSIWMEVALTSFAALIYFTLSNWFTNFYQPGKSQKPRKISIPPDHHGILPVNVGCRLLVDAARDPRLMAEISKFEGKIDSSSLEQAVAEANKRKDEQICHQLCLLANCLKIQKSTRTLEILARLNFRDTTTLSTLIKEAPAPVSRVFAKMVLEAATAAKDSDLAAELFEKVSEDDAPYLYAFVEKTATNLLSKKYNVQRESVPAQAKAIRNCASTGNLQEAIQIYEHMQQSGCSNNTFLFNSLLDTCIECGDLKLALTYFEQAKKSNVADVVSFNTIMKGYLAEGDIATAEGLLSEISKNNQKPTHASYNGLLNAYVQKGDQRAVWRLVKEMQSIDVPPNTVTCSILLKGPTPNMQWIIGLINTLENPMDEALFASFVDACTRTGCVDLLSEKIVEYSQKKEIPKLTAPTYGSMIKAYGQARQVQQIWKVWNEMVTQKVEPTSITFGCMIEALVANGSTMGAWRLVQQTWDSQSGRALVNTVVYSTILKGFVVSKQPDKVMACYDEMKERGVRANTITYNTMLNAFARCGAMHRVPSLLEDMKAAGPQAEPDVVTYSTIIKGFCAAEDLDKALLVLADMKSEGRYAPDEVMYNSLLDGCAKEHRLEDALRLMDEMKQSSVVPSNYTLSMLVKLLGRCRRLDQAFSMVAGVSKTHGIKVNIQVYTCLMQACFNNHQIGKALSLHDQIVADGIQPDEKTYTALVRGCQQAGAIDKAMHMVKKAYHLPGCVPVGVKPGSKPPGVDARCMSELMSKLGRTAGNNLLTELGPKFSHFAKPSEGKQTGGDAKKTASWKQRNSSGSDRSCS